MRTLRAKSRTSYTWEIIFPMVVDGSWDPSETSRPIVPLATLTRRVPPTSPDCPRSLYMCDHIAIIHKQKYLGLL